MPRCGTRARWINAPDNEASTGNLGFLLKLGKQTRIGGDFSMGKMDWNVLIFDKSLTPETARLIGQALGTEACAAGLTTIAIGRDGRLSGPTLAAALAEGRGTASGTVAYFAEGDLPADNSFGLIGASPRTIKGARKLHVFALDDTGPRLTQSLPARLCP